MPGSGRLLGQQNCTADVPQPEPGKECRGCRVSPPHTLDLGAAITPVFALLRPLMLGYGESWGIS